MNKLSTDKAPAAIGPYSQGVEVQGLIFTSGQIPINPAVGKIEAEGIEAQVLEAAGLSMNDVVKTTCLLANMEDFAVFNKVYEKYFISKPARSCFAVKALPAGALVEIEAIASK